MKQNRTSLVQIVNDILSSKASQLSTEVQTQQQQNQDLNSLTSMLQDPASLHFSSQSNDARTIPSLAAYRLHNQETQHTENTQIQQQP